MMVQIGGRPGELQAVVVGSTPLPEVLCELIAEMTNETWRQRMRAGILSDFTRFAAAVLQREELSISFKIARALRTKIDDRWLHRYRSLKDSWVSCLYPTARVTSLEISFLNMRLKRQRITTRVIDGAVPADVDPAIWRSIMHELSETSDTAIC